VIVRILTEGQYDVADAALDQLNQLDARVTSAIDAGDVPAFKAALASLLAGVRDAGVPHADDDIAESDLILPPSDATMDEVREMLADDGLIPG
jgi:hypothetical protein